jgi:hypothetical protein
MQSSKKITKGELPSLKTVGGQDLYGTGDISAGAVWGQITGNIVDQTDLLDVANSKQNTLVSGSNIKTINSTSIVGGGNIDVASTTHTHGNITNAGAIGSTANLPIITTASGVLTAGTFGTSANTFCQGNDSRLSDARVPTTHTHPQSEITNLVADLNGKQKTISIGTVAPSTPALNDLWIDTN